MLQQFIDALKHDLTHFAVALLIAIPLISCAPPSHVREKRALLPISVSVAAIEPGRAVLNLNTWASTVDGAASLQWTMEYPSDYISNVSVRMGSKGLAAGKQVTCKNKQGQTMCLVWGVNQLLIPRGTVVQLTVFMRGSVRNLPVIIKGAIASSADGSPIKTLVQNGTLSIPSGNADTTNSEKSLRSSNSELHSVSSI